MAFPRDPLRGSVQVVFQDPTDTLNPRYTAADTIGELLLFLGNMGDAAARAERIAELADGLAWRANCSRVSRISSRADRRHASVSHERLH
jgi:ABC-type microcin C transport system duplicated ATPase subunit YejF